MSRPIKFRAWDKEEKEYYYNAEHTYDFFCSGRGCYAESFGEVLNQPDRFIVEQYTGLKDKNGIEIYEGDRIKIEGSDTVYTVEYGRGVWVARFGDESGDNICLHHYVQKDIVLYAEVIGNIHEPPKDFRPEHLKRMGVSISKGGEE